MGVKKLLAAMSVTFLDFSINGRDDFDEKVRQFFSFFPQSEGRAEHQ